MDNTEMPKDSNKDDQKPEDAAPLEQAQTAVESDNDKTESATTPVVDVPAPVSPVAASEQLPATSLPAFKPAKGEGMLQRLTGQTRAYLAEYAVVLIVLASLIVLVNTFFSGIIGSFGEQSPSWMSSWQYKLSLGQLAAVVAIVPLLVVLTKRTTGTEDAAPAVKESNWRKAFLGVFLITMGLTAVGYAIGFVYVLVSMLANMGLAVDSEASPVQALVTTAFGALLFGLSALLYARDYRSGGGLGTWRKIHRYGLVTLAVVLAVVFAAIPLQKQRGAYVDSLIVGDFSSIKSKVSQYASSKNKLPTNLSELDVSDEVKTRIKSLKYEYKPSTSSYELCATFATDKSDKKDGGFASTLSALSSGSSLDSGSSSSQSPASHKKGHQCFRNSVSISTFRRSTNSSSSNIRTTTPPYNDPFDDSSYDDFDYNDSRL